MTALRSLALLLLPLVTVAGAQGVTGAPDPAGAASSPEEVKVGESPLTAIEVSPFTDGTLYILAGNTGNDNHVVWNGIIEAARAHGGPIGIVPAATTGSADDDIEFWDSRGGAGTAVAIPLGVNFPGSAEDPAVVAQIRRCGGIFFLGGDRNRAMSVLLREDGTRTPAFEAIWEVYLAGGVIAGSSAGAALMSNPMITGGTSADALLHGAGPQGVGLGRGAGFFPHGLSDQHFLRRGRLGRLIVATHASGFRYGFGVDEGCALVVDNAAQTATAIGTSGTVVVDTEGMTRGDDGRIEGVRVHYIETGDMWDLTAGEVIVASNKEETQGTNPPGPILSEDVWDDWEAWRLMTALIDTQGATEAVGTDPRFDVRFLRDAATRGYRGAVHDAGNTRRAYTVVNMAVEITPRAASPSGAAE